MNNVRRSTLKIIFRDKDITKYVENFSYSDNIDFTDDISITISNKERFFENDFFPEIGDTITAEIGVQNWNKIEDNRGLFLGSFEVDNIKYNVSKLTLKAVAIPVFSSVRDEKKYKTRENIDLSVIAEDIAKSAGLDFVFQSGTNPHYDTTEQQNESDLSYLQKLCEDDGLALKISGKQLIIFNESDYDTFEASHTLELGKADFYGFPTFSRNIKNIYSGCELTYLDTNKDKTFVGSFSDPKLEHLNKILKIEEKTTEEDIETQLDEKAKAKLRKQNKNEWTAQVKLKGDVVYFAGTNVNIKGFNKFDGKYNISSCQHSISKSGYVVTLKLRKCLEGY